MSRFVAWTPNSYGGESRWTNILFLITELSHSRVNLSCTYVRCVHCRSMYKAFRNLTTQESAGYGLLCVFFAKGIDYMDNHMPDKRALNASTSEEMVWNDRNKQATTTRTY